MHLVALSKYKFKSLKCNLHDNSMFIYYIINKVVSCFIELIISMN